jgi:hypothetical protein
MTEQMYVLQTLLIAGALFGLCWRESVLLRVQTLIWSIGVIVLGARFGLTEQLNFYSNDQGHYVSIVQQLSNFEISSELNWWLQRSKLPFTLPASLLALLGVNETLALKTVSLGCLLLLSRMLLKHRLTRSVGTSARVIYLTACGGIGIFYSILALRETMMMLVLTKFVLTKSPVTRILLFGILMLLRPHLAASVLIAVFLISFWDNLRQNRRETPLSMFGLGTAGVAVGSVLYAVGIWLEGSNFELTGSRWGVSSITRVASNYVGLQFITARSETVEFSIQALLVLRVALSETIVIPTLFSLCLLIRPEFATTRSRLTLVAFSVYLGLVTNTDFNSFRQNIPFMAMMGLVILHHSRRHRSREYAETSS